MSSHDDSLGKAPRISEQTPDDSAPARDESKPASATIISVHDGKHAARSKSDNDSAVSADTERPSGRDNAGKPGPEPTVAREQADPTQVSAKDKPEADTAAAGSLWRELASSSARPFLIGGISGAVMAAATVFLINELRPPMDPRVQPFADQLGGFIQRMEIHEKGLQAVQVDLVRLLEEDTAAKDAGTARDTRIGEAFTAIDDVRQQLKIENGPGSPVFSVAVAQLGTAVQEGGPFEAEWVTLFALTSTTPEMRAELQRLLPMARDGVDTVEGLRTELKALSLRNGIPNHSNNRGLIYMGTMFLQDKFGIPIGNTPMQQVMGELMAEADLLLQVGDLEGAISRLGEAGGQHAAILAPWLEKANRRRIAGDVTASLRKAAEMQLRARVTAKPATGNQ
jgi:hypothetical protein